MVNGWIECLRVRKITAYPASRNSSAESAPRVPPLKLSMKRTQCLSSGTVVPPEVTQTTGREREPVVFFVCFFRVGVR